MEQRREIKKWGQGLMEQNEDRKTSKLAALISPFSLDEVLLGHWSSSMKQEQEML